MKNIKLFFSITAIVIIILCSFTGDKRSTHPTNRIVDDFTEIILNNEEYSLTYNELISYEEQLKKLETGEQNTNDSKQLSIALAYLYYLNGEYDTSLNYFNQAHQIDDSADADLNLLVINGLAKCYMALGDNETSYFYFQHALSLAEQINDDFLAKEIHAFAHTIVSFNEGLEPAILLLENALKLSATPKTNIQNHLYLGSLYIAKQDYKNAVSHTQSGFELATKYKIPELKNSSIKELADLYYIQGKYNQAIILYEELLDGNYALPLKETLDILVYTADSYALIGKFKQAHEQINTFIEFITNEVKLPYSKITKELNWIYLLQTKIYLLQSDAESASFSLQKAFEMYKESPNVMYPNTDIWIEKLTLDLTTLSTGPSESILNNYIKLINCLKERDINDELYNAIRDRIIEISPLLNQDTLAVSYLIEKVQDLKETEYSNYDTNVDSIIRQFRNEKDALQIQTLQRTILIIIGLLITSVGNIIYIYRTNHKIKVLNAKLSQQNITDYLTQVYNKKYLHEYLERLSTEPQYITCMLIDIDYFKRYNDTYGHLAGDEILKRMGTLLKASFVTDAVFRYGGEEFCIISTNPLDQFLEDVQALYHQLEIINIEHKASLVENYLTLSSGIHVEYLNQQTDLQELIHQADLKLYLSKEKGRNQYTY